jgi:magnesium-transporting ATPase (P-type)
MVEEPTLFEGVISFMRDLGFFKVIIPFLLSFTLIYAILDKTKVLGVEPGTKDEPKRSLNAIIAFCVGLFVVGTELVVGVINEVLANMVIVILLLVFFLMTISVFMKDGGTYDLTTSPWVIGSLGTGIFLVFTLIFLAALGWLTPILEWVEKNWKQDFVATIVFLLGIAGFIWFLTKEPSSGGDSSKKKNKGDDE